MRYFMVSLYRLNFIFSFGVLINVINYKYHTYYEIMVTVSEQTIVFFTHLAKFFLIPKRLLIFKYILLILIKLKKVNS